MQHMNHNVDEEEDSISGDYSGCKKLIS